MAESLGVEDKADFLLGAIAPDCVNYGMEQASEKVRYTAHIRDKDYDKWKAQLKAFANIYYSSTNDGDITFSE